MSKDFLAYYSRKFSTVEVDSTFYRIPNPQAVANWKEQTLYGFCFSFKFPRVITHVNMLRDCQRESSLFLERTALLKEKLGPLLLQFPPSFGVERLSSLADFLAKLPKTQRYAVEVRDARFFNDYFYRLLKENDVALAWAENPFMPGISEVTSDFLYIRWEGDRKKVNGTLGKIEADVQEEDLRLWATKIKQCLNKDMDVFGYFRKYYSGYPPSDINLLSNLLR